MASADCEQNAKKSRRPDARPPALTGENQLVATVLVVMLVVMLLVMLRAMRELARVLLDLLGVMHKIVGVLFEFVAHVRMAPEVLVEGRMLVHPLLIVDQCRIVLRARATSGCESKNA